MFIYLLPHISLSKAKSSLFHISLYSNLFIPYSDAVLFTNFLTNFLEAVGGMEWCAVF